MPRIILHLDMNSYFASVEQQANSFLRGRPVGVCAYLSRHGCIIASSKEAKAVGIKTGCRVAEALNLCPKAVLLQNDPPKYRSLTKRIFKILAEYTENLEPYSIDEAFLDLTNIPIALRRGNSEPGLKIVRDLKDAYQIGQEINQRIKNEIGEWLTSSIGVAETKFWAKLLSDTGPKDGVSYIEPVQYKHYLESIRLTDIWGINYRLEKRFNRQGIYTPLDLVNSSGSKIIQHFGKYGYFLWLNLQGINVGPIKKEEDLAPKSIGHSYVLPNKTKDKDYLVGILMKLCEKTGRRLREQGLEA